MITIFVGPRGHGKTLLMSKKLAQRYLAGMRLMTNYGIRLPHEPINAAKLVEMGEDLKDVAMGIDEIHVLIDSRDSMSARNKMISYFILQTRKRHVVLYGTTQHESQIEIRLRRSVDRWVFCKAITKLVYDPKKGKKVRKKTGKFRYRVVDGLTGNVIKKFKLDGRKYFGLYDTEETITDFAGAMEK